MIHGDLKPDNVLLKDDKSVELGLVAKLTDFGVVRGLGWGWYRQKCSVNIRGCIYS